MWIFQISMFIVILIWFKNSTYTKEGTQKEVNKDAFI